MKKDEKRMPETKKNEFPQGKLKIFFSYATGTGKTYAMLMAAHLEAKKKDVVVGYIEPKERTEILSLLAGLEVLSTKKVSDGTTQYEELDLDIAIKRNPQIILVDELAHINIGNKRHRNRYMDVEELLKAGIDVYTTLDVKNIESLNDTIFRITGLSVNERIPDRIFDMADYIKFIDLDPDELINRLHQGKLYTGEKKERAENHFFKKSDLIVLRELALRRLADKIGKEIETDKRINSQDHKHYTQEIILTCITASQNNPIVIRSAKRLASAFKGKLITLYVENNKSRLSDTDKQNLQKNMELAEQLDARIVTVYGDDVALQISEYAKVSGVSKIVFGRSMNQKIIPFFGKRRLADQLISYIPSADIYIIPDFEDTREKIRSYYRVDLSSHFKEFVRAGLIILVTSLLSLWLFDQGINKANLLAVYFLGILLSSIIAKGIIYNFLISIISVVCYNFLFIEPRWTMEAYDPEYVFTMTLMFVSSFLISMLSNRIQYHTTEAAIKSYRTDVLFETTQQLQNAKTIEEVYNEIAHQIMSLSDYNVIIYPQTNNQTQYPLTYDHGNGFDFTNYINQDEMIVVNWVFKNNQPAGFSTNTFPKAKCLYMAIGGHDHTFAVIGIVADKRKSMNTFEKNLLIAMLAECGMSIERIQSIQEYNEISQKSEQEKLRYNLLRSISHDLRTPLTGISGSAMMLIENADSLSKKKLNTIYEDIYEDSNWLIQLSENLLSMTRLENKEIELDLQSDIVEDIINEAIQIISKRYKDNEITYIPSTELLMVKMDSRLIVQVLLNLIDNAIKYSKEHSEVVIKAEKIDNEIQISVADQGRGISKEAKQHIFDLFYTEHNTIGDSRRSVGLGLYLCQTIMKLHHGSIYVEDNQPQGSVFVITFPESEGE